VLVFNTGLWGELVDPEYLQSLMAAGSRAVCGGSRGGTCLWRKTSRRFICDPRHAWHDPYDRRCGRHHWVPRDTADRCEASSAGDGMCTAGPASHARGTLQPRALRARSWRALNVARLRAG
jgi:hypothetical protein